MSRARTAAHQFFLKPRTQFFEEERRRHARDLPVEERPRFAELTSGVARRGPAIDRLLDHYLKAGMRHTAPRMASALRVAVYELLALDAAEHAVVNEAVARFGDKGRKTRGLINAILRRILRERTSCSDEGDSSRRIRFDDKIWEFPEAFLPDPTQDALRHAAAHEGFDLEVARNLGEELGEKKARELMRAANRRPETTFRLANAQDDPRSFFADLESPPELVAVDEHPAPMWRATGLGDVGRHEAFREGRFTIQGEFASRVVPLLQLTEGERVFDLCAPPGGKTRQVLEGDAAIEVAAGYVDKRGRKRLEESLARGKIGSAKMIDVSKGLVGWRDERFDAILLDVPCSNSGVLNRRIEARERIVESSLSELKGVQRKLIRDAVTSLSAEGGRFVYSTCSVIPSENQGLLSAVLADIGKGEIEEEIRAFPKEPWRDGGYAARVRIEAD